MAFYKPLGEGNMAYSTVSDLELLDKSTEVFRTFGFEGSSMSRLSAATGLEKASLYHRFPGGKDELALAVATHIAKCMQQFIFEPLKKDAPIEKRLRIIIEQLRAFYDDGRKSCAFDALSLPGGSAELSGALQTALEAWLKVFTDIAIESGLPPREARLRAEEALTRIEGSLVLSRVLKKNGSFRRTLAALPAILTGKRAA
jgi:TetR/AcrR family transcriptional regulator, lmrAB and yxaGH operons repressor